MKEKANFTASTLSALTSHESEWKEWRVSEWVRTHRHFMIIGTLRHQHSHTHILRQRQWSATAWVDVWSVSSWPTMTLVTMVVVAHQPIRVKYHCWWLLLYHQNTARSIWVRQVVQRRTERYGNGRPECVDLNLGASATAKLVTPVCSLWYGKRTAPAVLRAEIAGNLTVWLGHHLHAGSSLYDHLSSFGLDSFLVAVAWLPFAAAAAVDGDEQSKQVSATNSNGVFSFFYYLSFSVGEVFTYQHWAHTNTTASHQWSPSSLSAILSHTPLSSMIV